MSAWASTHFIAPRFLRAPAAWRWGAFRYEFRCFHDGIGFYGFGFWTSLRSFVGVWGFVGFGAVELGDLVFGDWKALEFFDFSGSGKLHIGIALCSTTPAFDVSLKFVVFADCTRCLLAEFRVQSLRRV